MYNPDQFLSAENSLWRESFAITPDDGASFVSRGIYIGTGGDVALQLHKDSAPVVWRNVPAGTFLPVVVRAVYATGTTASDIIGGE